MQQEHPFFIDETDHEILMHKDVHFSGSFSLMLDYYDKESKGLQEAFSFDRLQELADIDAKTPLSPLVLDEEQQKEIQRAKKAYDHLHKLCQLPSSCSQKLAELILSEEEEPEEEMKALIAFGKEAIPLLIKLIEDEDFYNPLFPGYGLAPTHAISCLGRLQAQEAILPLFEAFSKNQFFGEEEIISAFLQIGPKAKEFLLKRLTKLPITKENENACIALLAFEDPLIASICLTMLENPSIWSYTSFCTYLLLGTHSLSKKEEVLRLSSLSLSKELEEEKNWALKVLKPLLK